MKAYSVDFVGELALFKKNDANDMVHISYNFIHKPILLGMFGSILGYSGYSKTVDVSEIAKSVNDKINKLIYVIGKNDKLTKTISTKIEEIIYLLSKLKEKIRLELYKSKIDNILNQLQKSKLDFKELKKMQLPSLEINVARSYPDYYLTLKDVKLAIYPMYEKPLKKVINGFNDSSGFSNSGIKGGATWQISEQIMIGNPNIRFRVFILGEKNREVLRKLKERLKRYETEYPLYFGKNEFFAHYENYQEYDVEPLEQGNKYRFHSLIVESKISRKEISFDDFDPFEINSNEGLSVYENLPYDLDEMGFYKKDLFMLSQKEFYIKEKSGFYNLKNKGVTFNVQFI